MAMVSMMVMITSWNSDDGSEDQDGIGEKASKKASPLLPMADCATNTECAMSTVDLLVLLCSSLIGLPPCPISGQTQCCHVC